MKERPEKFLEFGSIAPAYYCERHGILMTVKAETSYDIVTGKKKIDSYISRCPRFFCEYRILTGLISPCPNIRPVPQKNKGD